MPTEYETVDVRSDGAVGRVYVDRPEAMNAVNTQVLRDLSAALEEIAADHGAIVLTGTGEKAFIGGGDIKEFRDRSAVWFRSEFREAMADVEAAIEGCRVPVVAAVNGVALGGGTEIALMCDLVLATESARFGVPEIGLGIMPGSGGTQRLTHAIGYLRAKELVLTGRHVPATEAAEMGLANEVIADDAFEDRVTELAEDLAAGPPVAQWFAKKVVNEARANLDSGVELEAALAGILFETDDAAEGFAAFVEKREAAFGRDS